jgi:putative restriction endonuclease
MNRQSEVNYQRDLNYYCECFNKLNVSNTKKKGEAPYKPILILSVLDLMTQGTIGNNQILVSDELIETFKKYWGILSANSNYQGGLHYPFFHLQSDGFWHLKFKDTFNGLQPKTTNKLKVAVEYAYLDDELFYFLQDPFVRQVLIDSLVSTWFADSQIALSELSDINQNFDRAEEPELENFDNEINFIWRKSVIRNSFFRKSVVHAYDYRCAFCKLRITRNPNQNIVDGAHIKPFAKFLDSKIDNGLSLCKNYHWAFDLGWFSIDDNYKILVSQDLEDDSPHGRTMKDFHHQQISLPSNERYLPRIGSLKWHRENKFKP